METIYICLIIIAVSLVIAFFLSRRSQYRDVKESEERTKYNEVQETLTLRELKKSKKKKVDTGGFNIPHMMITVVVGMVILIAVAVPIITSVYDVLCSSKDITQNTSQNTFMQSTCGANGFATKNMLPVILLSGIAAMIITLFS